MRAGRDAQFIIENNKLLALSLGADYCAEHEWGIKEIEKSFDLNLNAIGLERRKINEAQSIQHHSFESHYLWIPPKRKRRVEKKVSATGFTFSKWDTYDTLEGVLRNIQPYFTENQKLYTAWNQSGFAAFSYNEQEQIWLKELEEHFATLNICIFLGGGGTFRNAGLVLAVADRVPEDYIEI